MRELSTRLHRLDSRTLQPAGHDAGEAVRVGVDVRAFLQKEFVDRTELVTLRPHDLNRPHYRIRGIPACRGKCFRRFDQFVGVHAVKVSSNL